MATYTYIVQNGETLRSIADEPVIVERLKSKYTTTEERVGRLKEMNNILDSEIIVVGQNLKYDTSTKVKAKTATSAPAALTAGMISTEQNTAYISWAWTKKIKSVDYTDQFEIWWQYSYGETDKKKNVIWYDGTVTFAAANERESTWVISNRTYKAIRAKVFPVSQKKPPDKKGKQANYFTGKWSTYKSWAFEYKSIETPSAPSSLTYESGTLTAKYDNVDPEWLSIQFQFFKDDDEIIDTVVIQPSNRFASVSIQAEDGHNYKVRACYSKDNVVYSDWSDYTASTKSKPEFVGGFTACSTMDKTSVYLKWEQVVSADKYQIEYTTDPKYFGRTSGTTIYDVNLKTDTIIIGGLTTGYTYYFRIRSVNDAGNSEWGDYSFTILGSKPNAPTTWSLVTSVKTGDPIIFYWVHNTSDASREKAAILEYKVNGETYEVTIPNTREEDDPETISSYTLDTSAYTNGATINWRVKTCGVSMEYGEYSMEREVKIYALPVVTITTGLDSSLLSYPLNISCTATQGVNTPITYSLSIIANDAYETTDEFGETKYVQANTVVYSKNYDITDTSLEIELGAGDVIFINNVLYTAKISVAFNSGIIGNDETEFTVEFEELGFDVDAEIIIDEETISAMIRPYLLDEEGFEIEDASLFIYRREPDGTFVKIAGDIENSNTYVIDPHPALDYARYRIVGRANETGAIIFNDVPGVEVGNPNIVLQWDETWTGVQFDDENSQPINEGWSGMMLELPYNVDVSDSYETDVETVGYIGRRNPVSYYGTQIGQTSSWSTDIVKDDTETLNKIRRLAVWMGDVYVREPSGTGYWATVKVSYSHTHAEQIIPVSFDITRVEGGI